MSDLFKLKKLIGKIETDYCNEAAFELSEAIDRLEYELEKNAKLQARAERAEAALFLAQREINIIIQGTSSA